MAYVKILKITSRRGIENAAKYVEDENKTTVKERELVAGVEVGEENRSIESAVGKVVDYAENSEKTEGQRLITGINCSPDTAAEKMRKNTEHWKEIKPQRAVSRDAFHVIQSFDPTDNDKLTPEEVHSIGINFAESLQHMDDREADPDRKYQMLVCTHVDKEHLHNHIILCAYDLTTGRMFHECKDVYQMMRNESDKLCRKHGLKVIERPDNDRRYSWKELDESKRGTSWKDDIRKDIVAAAGASKNWNDFKKIMSGAGYKMREGKYVTYINKEEKRVRDKTLGSEYTKEFLTDFWKKEEEKEMPEQDNMQNKTGNKANVTLEEAIASANVERFYQNNVDLQKRARKIMQESGGGEMYDENGKRRSSLEITLILVLKMLTGIEDVDYISSKSVSSKEEKAYRIGVIQKAIDKAKDYGIPDEKTLQTKKKEVGTELGSAKKEINKLTNTLNKSKTISQAAQNYRMYKTFIDEINQIENKEDRAEFYEKYSDELNQYRSAKAVLYRNNCGDDEHLQDFEKREAVWKNRRDELGEKVKDLSREYKDLYDIWCGIQLARDEGFLNGTFYETPVAWDNIENESREEMDENRTEPGEEL